MDLLIERCRRVSDGLDLGYRTTVGKKMLMALSGIILIGFVVAHMVGNLKIYLGAESLNHYGEFLREAGYPLLIHGQVLWMSRVILLLALVAHFWSAISLTRLNRSARPVHYKKQKPDASSYASRTMIWGGVILLLFVMYHLLHLTTGTVHPAFVHGDVYSNVVTGFQQWPVALFYIVAQIALGLHLHHGVWSMMRTLGGGDERREPLRRFVAAGLTAIVVVGNVSIPIAVLSGLIR